MPWNQPDPSLVLENRHVLVVPLNLEVHAPALWQAASPETNGTDLFRYNLATGPFATEMDFQAYLAKKASNPKDATLAVFSKRLDRWVGCTSLLNIRPDHGSLEVGSIWYTKVAQRTEVNTNVMALLFCHIFDALGYRRLEWKCNNENEASKQAALRLGFTYEGLFRQHFWDKGQNRDTAWYSIIDTEWPSVKQRLLARVQ